MFYKMVDFLKRNLCLNYKGVCSMDTEKALQSFRLHKQSNIRLIYTIRSERQLVN